MPQRLVSPDGKRNVLVSVNVTPRDAADLDAIRRAWGIPLARAAYWIIAGRLAELREERPDAEITEACASWLAAQGRKLGHHGVRSGAAARDREAERDGGPEGD
jgi:hypothetical protein